MKPFTKCAICFLLFLLVCQSTMTVAWGKSRIAIISEPGVAKEFSDLLNVALSGQKNVSLVEREEIDKIIQERSLASNDADTALKIGALLKADGLIFLKVLEYEQKKLLIARLVDADTSLVLTASRAPLPVRDAESWVANVIRKMSPSFEKLTVTPDKRVKISIVGFSSNDNSRNYKFYERMLPELLRFCLMREKDIFVLERSSMSDVHFEQILSKVPAVFLTPDYVLEGCFKLDAPKPDWINVDVSLKSASSENLIAVEEKKDDLFNVASQIAQKVTDQINKKHTPISFNRKAEIELLKQEAEWALKAGFADIAVRNCESAWALGAGDENFFHLFIKAYCRQLGYDSNKRCVNSGYNRIRKMECGDDQKLLEVALAMLDLARNHILVKKNFDDEESRILVDIVETSIPVLDAFYAKSDATEDGKLRQIRAVIRDIIEQLQTKPSKDYYIRNRLSILRARNESLWSETVDRAFLSYKTFLNKSFNANQYAHRYISIRRQVAACSMVDWKRRNDNEGIETKWKVFVESLCASKIFNEKVDGLFFKLRWMTEKNKSGDESKRLFKTTPQETLELQKELNQVLRTNIDETFYHGFAINSDKVELFNLLDQPFPIDIKNETMRLVTKRGFELIAQNKTSDSPWGFHFRILEKWLTTNPAKTQVEEMDESFKQCEKKRARKGAWEKETFLRYRNLFAEKGIVYGSENDKLEPLLVDSYWSPLLLDSQYALNDCSIVDARKIDSGLCLAVATNERFDIPSYFYFLDDELNVVDRILVPDKMISSRSCVYDANKDYFVYVDGASLRFDNHYCFDLHKYSRVDKKWSVIKIPVEEHVRSQKIAVVEKKAYFAFGNKKMCGVYEIDLLNKKNDLLCFSSRKPAKTPLDNVAPYQIRNVLSHDGTLYWNVDYKASQSWNLLAYDTENKTWKTITPPKDLNKLNNICYRLAESSSDVLLYGYRRMNYCYLCSYGSDAFSFLLKRGYNKIIKGMCEFALDVFAHYDGTLIAFFGKKHPDYQMLNPLIVFDKNKPEEKPIIIPLEFKIGDDAHKKLNKSLDKQNYQDIFVQVSNKKGVFVSSRYDSLDTQKNLVLYRRLFRMGQGNNSRNPGFWYIPWRDIKDYISKHE